MAGSCSAPPPGGALGPAGGRCLSGGAAGAVPRPAPPAVGSGPDPEAGRGRGESGRGGEGAGRAQPGRGGAGRGGAGAGAALPLPPDLSFSAFRLLVFSLPPQPAEGAGLGAFVARGPSVPARRARVAAETPRSCTRQGMS
jgi:hypothetical protein